MKKHIIIITLAITAILLMVDCKKKDVSTSYGSIYGTVTDFATGEPVKNANVKLRQNGETTLTGSDGNFQFNNVADGDYSLSITKEGYVDLDDNYVIVLKNGGNIRRDVQLRSAYQSFRVTINGTEIDTLDFGIDYSYHQIYYTIENDGTIDITVHVGVSCDWIDNDYIYDNQLPPYTSIQNRLGIDREKLNVGDNIGYLYVSSGRLTKTIVVKAKSAAASVVDNTTIISYSNEWNNNIARVSSSIIYDGGSPILEKGFEYLCDWTTYTIPCGWGNSSFQTIISCGSLKQVRAYAKNAYQTGYSGWVYFN